MKIDTLEKLNNEARAIRINTFFYLEELARMSPKMLELNGYRNRTNAEAVRLQLLSASRRIKKLEKEFKSE